MKRLFKSLSTFVLLVMICLSCKTTSTPDQINLNIQKQKFRTINFNDLFSLEKVIILEETSNSLLSEIMHIKEFNKELYISDNQHGIIYRFSDNGKFINTIGKKGQGPGELQGMINFLITDSSVVALDNYKLISYSHEGSFLKETQKPSMSFDILDKNENYLIYNMTTPKWDQLVVFDKSLKLISGFSPLNSDQLIQPMAGRGYLLKDKKDLFLTYPFSDTIFRIIDTIAEPYFIFGFDQRKLTNFNSLWSGNFDGDLSDYDYSVKDFISSDFLISSLAHENKSTLLLFNRNNNELTLIDSIKNGPDLINGSQLSTLSENGILYWRYNSVSDNSTFSFLKDVGPLNDNPILILTKIKSLTDNKN